jgi:hypothetical protein
MPLCTKCVVMTASICILLVLAILPMAFRVLAHVAGARFAFLALCWLPMAELLSAIGFHHHMGYGVLGLLAATLAASICLVGIGIFLCARARREKKAIGSLIGGTLLAGMPLVLFAGWLAVAH